MPCQRNLANVEKEQRMLAAIAAVKSGTSTSVNQAAIDFNVPYSTLKHRVNGRLSHGLGPYQKLLPPEELELVRWITQLTITGYSSQHYTVRKMAEAIRESRVSSNSSFTPLASVGQDWARNFLQRHPRLQTVVGKSIDNTRIKGTTVEALET